MRLSFRRAVFALLATLFAAMPVLAQEASSPSGDYKKGMGYLGACIGFGIAAGLAGLGQGRVAAAACEGLARNPGAGARIQILMLLGLAFIETLAIFTFVIVLIEVR
jgi:F-type H+-transporting ATPase subunit c